MREGRTEAENGVADNPERSSLFARAAAALVLVVYVAGISATVWFERRLGLLDENPTEDIVLFAGFGMFAVTGSLLLAKRPANIVGWIMSAAALIVGVFPASESYAAYVMTARGQPDWLTVFGAWANAWYWFALLALVLIYLPLLFPDGRLPSHRWLPVAVLPGIGLAGMIALGALTETLRGQNVNYRIDNPIGIEGLAYVEDLAVFGVLGALLAIGAVGAVASVAVRFRRSQGTERQQLKWFLYAAAPILTMPLVDYMPGIVSALVFGLVLVGLPTAIGVAILRYRLYNIDLVINRTLVYAALTVTLALLYFGSVVGLQRLFSPVLGAGNQLAVVASTLLIAALFGPLRRGLQTFIDRRFYRHKYDATKTLAKLSSKLRDETDLDALSNELVGVARETLQPAHASLWLRPVEGERRGGES